MDFDFRLPIKSYDLFLSALPPDELVIVEDEINEPKAILIGTVSKATESAVTLHHFTGIGRVVEPPERISVDLITCCQIRTNYIGFYQRHFERIKQSNET